MKAIAKQFVAQPIPLTGRRGEKFLGLRSPLGDRRGKATLILQRGRRGADLLANERPQPPRGGVEIVPGRRIQVARALGAGSNPSAVGQGLQVAAHRRLRQLHDDAQLGHGQLLAIQQQQDAAARRIGKGREVIENGRRRGESGSRHLFNPYIRMKGYTNGIESSTYAVPVSIR